MSNRQPRPLRVAAIQMVSENGAPASNRSRGAAFVEEAARRGAELILLPELMPTGYLLCDAIWDAAEPTQGPTASWLRDQARRFGVYLGTSFLEADGEDFYNTFVLASPEGMEAGRVRKQTPALHEARFFKGLVGPHVIDTALGRIGVGICYENLLAWFARQISVEGVDLLLMPHSAPFPARSRRGKLLERSRRLIATTAGHYAGLLGVPVVLANKSGSFRSPVPGSRRAREWTFPGLSTIADSDATVKAQLDDEEQVAVAEVLLDEQRKRRPVLELHGRWARRMPWGVGLCALIEAAGRFRYGRSEVRRQRARAAAGAAR